MTRNKTEPGFFLFFFIASQTSFAQGEFISGSVVILTGGNFYTVISGHRYRQAGRQAGRQTDRYCTICFNFWPTTEKKMHQATEQHTDALGSALNTSAYITTQQWNMRAALAISQWHIKHTQHVKRRTGGNALHFTGAQQVILLLFFCSFFPFLFQMVFIAPVFVPSQNSVACPKDSH